jgi:hypothetical protein
VPKNAVARGKRREKQVADAMKACGLKVWKTTRTRFQNFDLFSEADPKTEGYDVAAKHRQGAYILFLQVKSSPPAPQVRSDIEKDAMPDYCYRLIVWKRYDDREAEWEAICWGGPEANCMALEVKKVLNGKSATIHTWEPE